MVCRYCGSDTTGDLLHALTCDGRQGQVEASEPEPYKPFVRDSETSRAAAASLDDDRIANLRELVYRTIRAERQGGLTDLEIQALLGLEGSTERPRRIELVQAGRVVDSGRRRLTPRHKWAVVWVAAEFAEAISA